LLTNMASHDNKDMLLVAFLQASNCSNYTGSWRHPETESNFLDLAFYQNIATILEEGKFHLAFLDDRFAMPAGLGTPMRPLSKMGFALSN